MAKIRGDIDVEFGSPAQAGDAKSILESEAIERGRSSASMRVSGATLSLSIEARDVAAFRAAVNTALRLISVIKSGAEEG